MRHSGVANCLNSFARFFWVKKHYCRIVIHCMYYLDGMPSHILWTFDRIHWEISAVTFWRGNTNIGFNWKLFTHMAQLLKYWLRLTVTIYHTKYRNDAIFAAVGHRRWHYEGVESIGRWGNASVGHRWRLENIDEEEEEYFRITVLFTRKQCFTFK